MENLAEPRRRALKTSAYFFCFCIAIAAIISSNYFPMLDLEFAGTAWIFTIVTQLGHFWTLALIAWLIFAFPWALAFPQKPKTRAGICIAAATIFLAILTADTFVYGIYRYHIYNEFVLDLLFSSDAAGIFVFSGTQYFFAILLLAILAAGTTFCWWLSQKLAKFRTNVPAIAVCGICAICLLTSHMMHAYFYATAHRSVHKIAQAFPIYFPLTANRFLTRNGFVDPAKVREKIRVSASHGKFFYPRNPLAGTPCGKNILVIFIDSWNARTFAPDAMPNLCKFAEKSQIFENHYSGDHGTRTGVMSFFTGIPGLYFNDIEQNAVPAPFIQFLQNHDYKTQIVATAGLDSPPFARTIFSSVPAENLIHRTGGDKNSVDKWLEWTAKNCPKKSGNLAGTDSAGTQKNQPFFGFIFLDLLHSMHLPKGAKTPFPSDWTFPKYEQLSPNMESENFFNLYKNCAFFVDQQLGRIFDDLRERGLLENTIVILTGDHGQEFNENRNNIWGHGSAFSRPQLHVPFVLFDASREPKKFAHWTAHYDASVTILQDYCACGNAVSDYSVGKNLFDETPREWLLVGHPEQFGIVEKDRTTHVNFDRTYDILDNHYREFDDAKLHAEIFKAALKQAKEYYQKK